MNLNLSMEAYISSVQAELFKLIRDLCKIPAPSGFEEKRAEFCRKWFEENGCSAFIDEAQNVICPLNDTGENDLIAFTAHTDTVFPDTEPMPFSEKDGIMCSPGVTDDTASLAVMMICARHIIRRGWKGTCGLLFIADSGEEGLGNLRGCRQIMKTYGGRIRELITLDGTKIDELYAIEVPKAENSRTTYNVGVISGGTSVNTIAQYAEMYYEYRSDSLACMQQMETMFSFIINAHRLRGVDVAVEKIGDRPCGNIAPEKTASLKERIETSIKNVLKKEAVFGCGSTDANMPLSMGIPSICMSVCEGGKCHTREEWLDTASLQDGCRLFLDFLVGYEV